MRMDKLTRSLQAAVGEAQSLAIGRDHPFIEPLHLLKAMLDPASSASRALLMAAGAAVEPLQACLLYTSPSPRDRTRSRMPSSA